MLMNSKKNLQLRDDQRGIVSIFITVIIILLMSLIILAMARNSTREGRQSLDRQLSDQAFYNAESGINDWTKYINENKNNPSLPVKKTECDPKGIPATLPNPPNNELDGPNGVNKYTCVMYNRTPSYLVSQNKADTSEVFLIKPNSAIDHVDVKWSVDGASLSGCGLFSSPTLPTSSSATACNIGGLRLELFKKNQTSRDDYINNSMVFYAFPNNGNGNPNISFAEAAGDKKGAKKTASCTGQECSVTVNGINIGHQEEYYLVVKRIYLTADTSTVVVSGGSSSGVVAMLDSQVEIDVTGKANDVLRRIKVHKPLEDQYTQVGTGVDSLASAQSICKLIKIQTSTTPNSIDTIVHDDCE